MMRVLIVLIICFLLKVDTTVLAQGCSAGNDCQVLFTSDEIENNAVIFAMKITDEYSVPDIPIIRRLDENGDVEWEIQGDLEGYTHLNRIRLYDLMEDYIYALLTIPETHHNSTPLSQIWKINKLSGALEWKSDLYESDFESRWHSIGMFEYDENLICFYNPLEDNNGGTIGGFELYTIDKETNTVDFIYEYDYEYEYGSNQWLKSIYMLCDHQGNIITTSFAENTDVEKFNGLNLNHRIWHYDFSQSTLATVKNIEDFVIDNKGFLYLFTNLDGFIRDSLTLTKLNGMTGELQWNLSLSTPFRWLRDKKIFQNELYVGLREISGASQRGGAVKVDIENGSILWSNYDLEFNAPGSTSNCHGNISGIRSIDIDCNGFVYATGFDQSSYHDFAPGAWGIMKLDDNTGAMIESNIVSLDTANVDIYSHGAMIHVLNDSLLVLGYLQTDSANRVLTVVKGDNMISTLDYPWFSIDQQVACDSMTWIDGITYTSSNNSAIYNFPSASGCDSIIKLDLSIDPIGGVNSITSCDPIVWIDGNTYTTSNNTASHLLTSVNGCDSLVNLDLTILQVDTTLTISDSMIIANSTNGMYQWLDCDNSFLPLIGDTLQSFTAVNNGSYALMITENGCTDTSNCVSITTTVGIGQDNEALSGFTIFPNPTSGIVNIEFSNPLEFSTITIRNAIGQLINVIPINKNKLSFEIEESDGVYFIEFVKNTGHRQMVKLIKY